MKRIILIMCSLFLIVGCATDEEENKIKVYFDKVNFETKRTQWLTQNLQNYQYRYEHSSSNGPYQFDVIVENGVVTSEKGVTIDKMFEQIETSYLQLVQQYGNQKTGLVKAVYYIVRYNSEYHFPERISISFDFSELPPPGYGGQSNEVTDFQITE